MTCTTGIRLNIESNAITGAIGLDPTEIEAALVNGAKVFNMPRSISIKGTHYFPLSYEFKRGDAWYLLRRQPKIEIDVLGFERVWGETRKFTRSRITPRKTTRARRPYDPKAKQSILSQTMGKSTTDYAQKLTSEGHLAVPSHLAAQWCWCPLKVLHPSHSHRNIARRHILMATEACHSQLEMLSIVSHRFADESQCSLTIEVFATIFPTTCLADRIQYQLWEPKSDTVFIEYVDARTTTQADALDIEDLYANLMATYQQHRAL